MKLKNEAKEWHNKADKFVAKIKELAFKIICEF